jgi:hypothetical protein
MNTGEDRIAASAKSKELVVFSILRDSACGECNKELAEGALLLMEADRPLCLSCADLGHLIYLPRGDAALTRRAKKYSTVGRCCSFQRVTGTVRTPRHLGRRGCAGAG